jgi:epoxyqueuosine reductase
MEQRQSFDSALLDEAGLNRHAVFNIDALPEDLAASVRNACPSAHAFRQLILIGHAGRRLWEAVKASGIDSEHPIDEFTVHTVKRWFAANHPGHACEIVYPGTAPIGLQRLGQLAGWHHATPFMVGIDSEWGTWFAYRAVVLADTAFEPTRPVAGAHACDACMHKRCIAACPAGALEDGRFELRKCIAYRKQDGSLCKATCVARISCPVGDEHRYCDEQICHSYTISMRAIEQYC